MTVHQKVFKTKEGKVDFKLELLKASAVPFIVYLTVQYTLE